MIESSIFYFKEKIKFRLADQDKLRRWILKIIQSKNFELSNLNFIFCSDEYLRKINREYLNHNFFTDIITFDYSSSKKSIAGDIFISIDRVRINAKMYNNSFKNERRVC